MTSSVLPQPPSGIVAHGLARSFGSVHAVRDVSLTAPAGSVTALVGPNGSGKTTLMLLLATLLRPDRGSVSVAGVDAMADPGQARRLLGWMPDTLGVWDSLTCADILTSLGRLYGMGQAEAATRAREQLAWVQLEPFADRPARVLSRGQQQRLSLARATVHRPAVLMLDEPANGLDPTSRIRLRDDVRAMAAAGVAVLVSSHVLAELEEMADRAVFVSEGATVAVRDLSGADDAGRERPYRIAGPDPSRRDELVRALQARGVPLAAPLEGHRPGVVVRLRGEDAAAALLADLVAAGVPVSRLAPEGSRLENAYLDLALGGPAPHAAGPVTAAGPAPTVEGGRA
ncbi:ABC transporter ATP-binding protein [Micrococcus porci]|uniref:ABC transporter ATP-binding protein n=1 Tax=Micrococcus TaxID=1269 RepID=UPI001CCEE969|nr:MULTISPECIES: ABC transporter ATP-binding protein [Micrococcus]MCG7422746.1 ABC transporter ATP-binding protein [Micrococcus sp. ACRRV]UBH24732.1 ABC transporter ATP-binding protein [Micrococcus porci]